jgi:hypothetical protein
MEFVGLVEKVHGMVGMAFWVVLVHEHWVALVSIPTMKLDF